MKQTTDQQQPYSANKAIAILRICLWLMPGFILPFGVALGLWFQELWLIAIIPIFAVFVSIGYLDMRLKFQQEHGRPNLGKQNIWLWAVVFALFQVIIAPAVILLVAVTAEQFNIVILGRPAFWLP
jgi:hypothetical protein